MVRVVVIGGGYAGTAAAKTLEKKAPAQVEVVLIEPKTHFYHIMGSARAAVDLSFSNKVFVPYDKLFKNTKQNKIVHASVLELNEKSVILDKNPGSGLNVKEENGKFILDFDYAILATGRSYTSPFSPSSTNIEDVKSTLDKVASRVKESSKIVLIGAGPVGIETAGEIKTLYPEKQVTVISSSDKVIPGPYSDKFRAKLNSVIDKKGIKVILNAAVKELPPTLELQLQPQTVALSDGSTHGADMVLKCVGSSKKSLVPIQYNLNNLFDDKGFIKVHPSMQCESYSHLFSCGDNSNADQAKLGFLAGLQAGTAAKNIATLIKANGKPVKLANYKAPGSNPMILVPVGNDAGAGQLPVGTIVVGSTVLKMAKGKDMFASQSWKELNQTMPKN